MQRLKAENLAPILSFSFPSFFYESKRKQITNYTY